MPGRDGGDLVSYWQPDPDLPLPIRRITIFDTDCDDEHVLERWRVSNGSPRTVWFDDADGVVM